MEIRGSVPKPEGVLNTFGVYVGPALVMTAPLEQCLFELLEKTANVNKCFMASNLRLLGKKKDHDQHVMVTRVP
jgi:hypothetical protein